MYKAGQHSSDYDITTDEHTAASLLRSVKEQVNNGKPYSLFD